MRLSHGTAAGKMIRVAAAAAAGLRAKAGVALRRRAIGLTDRKASTPTGVWIPVTGRALEPDTHSRAAAG